jgi:hypothetical protein
VWEGGGRGEADLLRRAYGRSFALARAEGSIRSIAFPAIATGVYRFPKPLAAEIAVGVMRAHEAAFERIVAEGGDYRAEPHHGPPPDAIVPYSSRSVSKWSDVPGRALVPRDRERYGGRSSRRARRRARRPPRPENRR